MSYIDVDEEISFKVQPAVAQSQDENDYNSCNTARACDAESGKGSSVTKPALQERKDDIISSLGTPQTAKRARRSSDVQGALQEVTFRLDDEEPPTVVKPLRDNKRMSVGFGLSMRNACKDDFYAPKYSEAELETLVEERCAELQKEHDRQLCAVRNDLLNAESRAETLDNELQSKSGDNQKMLFELAAQLEDLDKKAEEAANENVLLKAQVSALAKQIHHYETEGQTEAAEMRSRLEEEKSRHAQELQQQLERHAAQISEFARERDEQLRVLRSDNQKMATELQCQVETLARDVTEKAAQLKQQAAEKDIAIQALQQSHASEIEQTKLKVKESFRKKFEKGNQEYNTLQQQHESSVQQVQALQQQLASLQEAEQLAQASAGQLKEVAQRAESQLAHETARSATLGEELSALKNELSAMRCELAKSQSELQDTVKERDAQMFAVARLVTGKEATEAELAKLRSEAEALRTQNTQLTGMNEQLLEMLEKHYAEQEETEGGETNAP